ncbi:S8 family peptidase, partial [Vibrio alginolyticus]|nr:S8 family peptidase [Vibrio alginolyticus]
SVHEEILADFTSIAVEIGVEVSQYRLRFPEHTITQVKASKSQLSGSTLLLSRVAEIRAPRVTAELFDSSTPVEQAQWSQDLLDRLKQSNNGNEPYVCILDTGVNVEHPLLAPFANTTDQLTVTYDRVPVDSHGHGTGMAGLAIWGDLTEVLSGDGEVSVNHKLESVKVIDNDGDNKDKPLGLVTSDAVSTAFIANPGRDRVFSMSLSSNTPSDRGRASSWSTALDALAADSFNRGDTPCLFTVCAGNAQFNCFAPDDYPYPEYNQIQGVSDPAQAWNVVTVGAYTSKTTLTESGDHYPLASSGGISPHTTTSLTWDRSNAPVKPEVVFEGGNIGKSELDYRDDLYDLHLLTTHNDFSQRHYQTSYATSAATALAARFTAQVKTHYPDLWPETVRALMIHSADWTDEMFKLISVDRNDKSVKKGDMVNLTRMVGFGVPNLDKALWSANNSLSMVVQNEIQPFHKDGSSIKTKDMHLYELPWPRDALLDLGDTEVELTVTLSYFVEPNPSSRNILNKYNYASHQLRFDVKRPLESANDFQKRVNKANRASKTDKPTSTDDSNWRIGSDNRHKGSIHKDIWRGSAAELAERGQIAIYPASGWWKTRTTQNRWESNARYALVVSIAAPKADVDIYTEVDTKIAVMAAAKAVVTA